MNDTLLGLIVATLVVLPGFVTQELTVRRRPSARTDGQSAIQRALFFSVLIQLIWSWDTWRIVEDLSGHHWRDHFGEVVVWLVVVIVATPFVLGSVLNAVLVRAERGGQDLRWWHYALGGRDAREAWDYMFQTLDRGAWVLVRLVASTAELPVMFVAKYGDHARHAQSPAPHDVYFDEVWSTDIAGVPIARISTVSGMWLPANQIEAIFPMAPQPADTDAAPTVGAGPLLSLLVAAALLWALRPRRLQGRH